VLCAGLVGKGICFDTGGLTLKSDGGRLMKVDMAGAAVRFLTRLITYKPTHYACLLVES
jgi:leucyl aminopeptidase